MSTTTVSPSTGRTTRAVPAGGDVEASPPCEHAASRTMSGGKEMREQVRPISPNRRRAALGRLVASPIGSAPRARRMRGLPRRAGAGPARAGEASEPLDDGAGAQAPAAAHRDEAVATARALQLVEGLGEE